MRRNDLAPICRLPPELLCAIFKECIFQEDVKGSWVDVTHVCALWRETALQDPTLWCELPGRTNAWTATMLSRSRGLPLHISGDPRALSDRHDSAMSQTHLIETLTLYNRSARSGWMDVSHLVASPMPILKILSVSGPYPLPCIVRSIPNCPALQDLRLQSCIYDWYLPLPNRIVRLCIEDLLPSRRPNLDQLLAILEHLPQLEELQILRAVPRHSTVDIQSTRVVKLPYLKKLVLHDELIINGGLLCGLLRLPHSAYVELECEALTTLSICAALPAITEKIRLHCEEPSDFLALSLPSRSSLRVWAGKQWECGRREVRFGLRLSWMPCHNPGRDELSVPRAFCGTVALDKLRFLQIHQFKSAQEPSELRAVLDQCANVEFLSWTDAPLELLMELLVRDPPSCSNTHTTADLANQHNALFPKLLNLRVCMSDPAQTTSRLGRNAPLIRLENWLRHRPTQLQSLELMGYELEEERIASLKFLVRELRTRQSSKIQYWPYIT